MTTTYDPTHPSYLDQADVRTELSRVFDVCHGCRRCADYCPAFSTLFDLLDRLEEPDAGLLTPAEQDDVVDGCLQCKRCAIGCPALPGLDDRAVDVPRLMMRATAMRRAVGLTSTRGIAGGLVLRTDLAGSIGSRTATVANRMVDGAPNSVRRRVLSRLTGVSPVRLLPSYARQRFSAWFADRGRGGRSDRERRVTIVPTCHVEYHDPQVGRDLVQVLERNGVGCQVTAAGCCGAPWLHAGDVQRFAAQARANVERLAREVRSGTDLVVLQPTCSYVLRHDYRDHVGGADAELVAEHTFDASGYLVALHRVGGLDTRFQGECPGTVTYHFPCHQQAQEADPASAELLRLTGAEVRIVTACAGIDGLWGLRAGNEEVALPMAAELGAEVERRRGQVVAGDCGLANTAVTEQTGRTPVHPVQVLARAYGDAPEPG